MLTATAGWEHFVIMMSSQSGIDQYEIILTQLTYIISAGPTQNIKGLIKPFSQFEIVLLLLLNILQKLNMCSNLKLSALILITIFATSNVSALKFTFTLKSSDKSCFSELLTESTPFHFRIEAPDDQYDISLNHHDGTPLVVNKRADRVKKIDSYASVTGEYYLCIINKDSMDKNMTFNFYHGIELSDLSALPKQQDSKIIDSMVDNINEVYQTVKEQESYSRTVNEYNMELQKLVSFKSVGFVFLSITVVLIISFLHYLEIKRVLKNRKII